jgi:PncC family amidohydrolase
MLSELLTEGPGASTFYLGGVVAYSNEAKVSLLGVKEATLRRHGAVSAAAALEMAAGARRALGADMALAVTGIAGPEGGSELKPVGLVFIAFDDGVQRQVEEHHFSGDREAIRRASAEGALDMALRMLAP